MVTETTRKKIVVWEDDEMIDWTELHIIRASLDLKLHRFDLRTLSGHRDVAPCRIRSPGKRSATGEAYRHAGRTTETQKAHPAGWALHLFDAWQFPTLTWGDPTLPSALRRFTSEFGMGSGGTTALVPPGKFCFINTSHRRID